MSKQNKPDKKINADDRPVILNPNADTFEDNVQGHRPSLTKEELLQRAKTRAASRAVQKAERAKAAGLTLPKPKPKPTLRNGWAILRDKLRRGVLLKELKELQANDDETMSDVGQTPAHTKIEMDARKSVFSKTEEKMSAVDQKLAKIRQKKKQQERAERRKLLKKRQNVERELEYLSFPTILGWYFDGFFTPRFQLNQQYADHFNKLEIKLSKKKEKSIKETFAEKARRYFWPPEIISGMFFRTRGIYLDFKDIIRDPPHTPPDIAIGQRDIADALGGDIKEMLDEARQTATDTDLDDENKNKPKRSRSEQIERQLMKTDPDAAILYAEERTKRKIEAIEKNPRLKPKQKEDMKRKLLKELQKKKDRIRLEKQSQQNRKRMEKEKTKKKFYPFARKEIDEK